jgi:hypothetical protein
MDRNLWPLIVLALSFAGCAGSRSLTLAPREGDRLVVVFQPSHQADTGVNFNEALVSKAIADAELAACPARVKGSIVWSYEAEGLHHSRAGSNTKIEHTSAVDSGRISGYAWEVRRSNAVRPDLFIALHNNGATGKNGCWGYVHEGDADEAANRAIVRRLVREVCLASGLEDLGDHGDSEPNRNDYRCSVTGKLSFYSLDENVNTAPCRVLLEIGDNAISRSILLDPGMQRKMGEAIAKAIGDLYPAR